MSEDPSTPAPKRSRWRHATGTPRARAVVVATGILAIGVTSVGVAATGSSLREGVRNGTTHRETEIVSNIAASTGQKGGYSTRQSNLSSSGGGAIYGCRSGAGNSASTPPQNPCVRSNNLSTGEAFEFNATKGLLGGTINVGAGGDGVKPFTTNATGVATGLNADRVDGANAQDIINAASAQTLAAIGATGATGPTNTNGVTTRWFRLAEDGSIEAQSGGFTVKSAYVGTNNNVYVDTGENLAGSGLSATIAIRNVGDNQNFGGEVSISKCSIPNVVTCAPDGTNNDNTLVVSPRNSDGTATAGTTASPRKRVYVTVTP